MLVGFCLFVEVAQGDLKLLVLSPNPPKCGTAGVSPCVEVLCFVFGADTYSASSPPSEAPSTALLFGDRVSY